MKRRGNGRFELYYRQGWAWLVVHPPEEGGSPVYHEDVLSRMRMLGIPRVSSSTVRRIVERADGQASRLIEWPGGARLASTIEVHVAQDGMSAAVSVTPPLKGAAPPAMGDVIDALSSAGVVYGVSREAVVDLLRREEYGRRIDVATGKPVMHARSARVRYHFDPDRGKPYLVMSFDRINLRELNFIENVHDGDLLAELVPPVPPRDGVTVLGTKVPARTDVEPVELVAGPNAELTPDRTGVVAASDGNVRLVNGAIVVEPLVTVERVDYATGNIRFEGSVIVEKDIADGFIVQAEGDVQVGRGVGRATIRAGGNVLLKAGVSGGGAARIECEGNLFAKYIESSTIRCRGNVFVEEAIMHSHVSTWKSCVLNGRRSEVIGSTIVVAGSLWCKKLGSVAEAPMQVSIGVDPELLAAFRDARHRLEVSESRIAEVEREIEQIDRLLRDNRADEKLSDRRGALAAELAELCDAIPQLRTRAHDYRESLEASRTSRLVVEDTIFRGAVILFGTTEYHAPERGAHKTILRKVPGGIREEGYNAADRPKIPFD